MPEPIDPWDDDDDDDDIFDEPYVPPTRIQDLRAWLFGLAYQAAVLAAILAVMIGLSALSSALHGPRSDACAYEDADACGENGPTERYDPFIKDWR